MTHTLSFSHKPLIIGATAAFLLAASGMGLALWHNQTPAPQNQGTMPAVTAPQSEAAQALLNQALARIDGVPPDTSISGTLTMQRGKTYEVSELASRHGQRVIGISPALPDNFEEIPYTLELRLNNAQGQSRVLSLSLQTSSDISGNVVAASLKNFPADTKVQLVTGGGLYENSSSADWSGNLSLRSQYQKRDLFQLYITLNQYEHYTLYTGDLLPYYLQNFTGQSDEDTYKGIEAFPLSDEATTPDANRLADELSANEALGWWINSDHLLTRIFDNSCGRSCPTKIYAKSLDGWTEIFATDVSNIWVNLDSVGQQGDILYTESSNAEKTRWKFDEGAYRPDEEGAPSP